jgi:O-methyltransferase
MGAGTAARDAVKKVVPGSLRRQVRRRVLDPLRGWTPLVPEEDLREAYVAALELLADAGAGAPIGDYVEFGVCHGSSMACMAEASDRVGLGSVRLIGFDSFEGLPQGVEGEDDGVWAAGEYSASERAARRLLRSKGVSPDRVVLVKGWFDDTATPATAERLGIRRVSVAMLDCDAYSSTRTALAFLAPLLAERCVLFFDDWNTEALADKGEGERRAFEEWLAAGPGFRVAGSVPRYADNAEVLVLERVETG